jgi:hypothetical protein
LVAQEHEAPGPSVRPERNEGAKRKNGGDREVEMQKQRVSS